MIKKIILRVLVFVLVAVSSAYVVNKINNINLDKVSREMDEATLPVVYSEFDGNVINPMHGYRQVMSIGLMRENVVPLNEDYSVNILVSDEADIGKSYSYELRTMDGASLIEKGDLEESGSFRNGYRKFHISFRMDMALDREYALVFMIHDENDDIIRYYTRVANLEENQASQMIRFANEFHNICFVKNVNEDEGNKVYNLLKTTGEGADNDLSHVTLASSYDMVSWGDMNLFSITGIVPEITEIDKEFAVVKLSYIAENYNPGESHFYNIREYYSMRYNKDNNEIELLAFDRYQSSFFDEYYISKDRNSISLGISNQEVEYMASSDNKKLALVKEGELWSYDYKSANLTSVFSFSQNNYSDSRLFSSNTDINILSVDDNGNISFLVYGYMCRGKHEGENGISLYYFDADNSRISETLFVESGEPFDVMKKEVGEFSYLDKEGRLFFLLGGYIYSIDTKTKELSIETQKLTSEKYKISKDRKIVAFPDNINEEDVKGIIIRNFETGEEYYETGSEDDRFQVLGFVDDDVIYGTAKASDIIISTDGKVTLPLNKIYIVRADGTTVKEYSKPGLFIMNAYVMDDKIYLKRAMKQNSFYSETEPDFISYKSEKNEATIGVSPYQDSLEMFVWDITFPSNMYISNSAHPVMTKHKDDEGYKELCIEATENENQYYVFTNSGYSGEYNTAGKAIEMVVKNGDGLVVNSQGKTIYRNLDARAYNTIADSIKEKPCEAVNLSLMTCAYMCIEYIDSRITYEEVMAYSSYEEAFEELTTGIGINISGIELSTALYFLDRDIPFAACIGEDARYVLVISYNSTHIRYYDPVAGQELKVTREAFEEALSMHGNTMFTYNN